jgi:leucyl-tRNA synthetase
MASYDHKTIDAHWQAFWERERTFATPTDRTRPKYYVLDMFPYPSGRASTSATPRATPRPTSSRGPSG